MPHRSFLQSAGWEAFQRSLGRKTWRAAGALVIRHDFFGGFNYLYAPRPDPFGDSDAFFSAAEKIASAERSVFLKCDPLASVASRPGLRTARAIQPRRTVIIDCAKPAAEILGAMHPKTRYNIRLAERKGVAVRRLAGADAAAAFWDLLGATAARDGFRTHSREHYEKLCAAESPDYSNELFFAYAGTAPIAAALVNFHRPSGTATYLHGASSNEHRALMAPHLLHWRIIEEARHRGFGCYDLWGIDERRWPGVTRFKLGFGGRVVEYPPSFDIVWRRAPYAAYRLVRRMRI